MTDLDLAVNSFLDGTITVNEFRTRLILILRALPERDLRGVAYVIQNRDQVN
jgi:hypothetical protein